MWKTLLIGALHLSLFTIPACGPAGSRPGLTEEEYRLYRGTVDGNGLHAGWPHYPFSSLTVPQAISSRKAESKADRKSVV